MTVHSQAKLAKDAAYQLAHLSRQVKDAALKAMAEALTGAEAAILEANLGDVEAARAAGMSDSLVDRLTLTPARIADMAKGLIDLTALGDPVGEVIRGWTTPSGLDIRQVRVPLGVVGIIYEARPNVTADAAGICLKAGNAALLRGSSSAKNSNLAIVKALQDGLVCAGLDPNAVQLICGPREVTTEMMNARGLIDVLIPRGGAGLIKAVVEGSSVPVIETGTGNCHLFVDASADIDVALAIMLNAKVQRPSVCNAIETMLVHESIADEFLPKAIDALDAAGVTIHGDERVLAYAPDLVVEATESDYETEYLSLDLAVKVVADIDEAIAHIRHHTTGHSETIVTNEVSAQRRFTRGVDAAAVLVNASSRFVDGGQFGFGAEIGISTQKLHARGPMGVAEMTSTKFIVEASGAVRD